MNGVAIVGDSLADNLAEGLAAGGRQLGLPVFNAAISGCGVARSGAYRLSGRRTPLSPFCARWPEIWAERLRRDRPKVVAIQVGRHEVLDRLHEGAWANILEPRYLAYVRSELELAIRVGGADGAKVVLLTAPKFSRPGEWPENDPARVDRFNELLRELASTHPEVVLIDLAARTSPGSAYVDVVDGVALRLDGVHYSRAGVEWIGGWLLPQLASLL